MDKLNEDMLFAGTIVHTIPDEGVAVVRVGGTGGTASSDLIAYYPGYDCEYGASPTAMFPEGSSVVCTRLYTGNTNVCYILGGCNLERDMLGSSAEWRKLYNIEDFIQCDRNNAKSCRRLTERMLPGATDWIKNHANGSPGDALPGDVCVLDKRGNCGSYIGRLSAQLVGSPLAFIDATSEGNKVRTVAETIERHTLLHEDVVTDSYAVSNTAISLREAMGSITGELPTFDEEKEEFAVPNECAIPMYRLQHVEGAAVEGAEDTVVMPKAAAEYHTPADEPTVLSRIRRDVSGELSSASALGIMSVKTPVVTAIQQLGYGKTPLNPDARTSAAAENKDFDDLREPYEAEAVAADTEGNDAEDAVPEKDAIMDAAINKLVSSMLSGPYHAAFVSALADSGLSVSGSASTIHAAARSAGKNTDEDNKPVGGVCNGTRYDPPRFVDINDPATGETHRYYDSMSFISQEPDGSICICDGYGSEIRMSQGNIYISPALDLVCRPGRDFSVMAPRHASVNAQETVTVNSSKGTYIRSCEDLKIAGATEGSGVTSLECLATNTDVTKLPGLVIRSGSHISITGAGDMLIGRKQLDGASSGAYSEPEAGRFVLDAGRSGTVYMKGGATTVDTTDITLCASEGSNASALSVAPTRIYAAAKDIYAPAKVYITAVSGGDHSTVSVMRNGLREDLNLGTAKGDECSLFVDGNAYVDQDIFVNGTGKFCAHDKDNVASIQASGISCIGVSENLAREDKNGIHMFQDLAIPTVPQDTLGASATSGTSAARTTVYQDAYTAENGFSFPLSYGVPPEPIPGMVWQELSTESDNTGDTWQEHYFKNGKGELTATYPGIDVWNSADVSVRKGKEAGKLNNNGYRTNTKH